MLIRDPAQDEVSQIGVALQPSVTMRPTTERVTQAFRDEAIYGIGTLNADMLAYEAKKPGQRISYDEWKASPYFDESITYYPSMTIEGAIANKEMVDFSKKNAEIINRATLGQAALGYSHAFAVGLAEPKNLLSGVAASAVLSPIGGSAVIGLKSSSGLLQIYRSMNRYGQLATRGFGEGLVAATLMEPSNRSSAKVLQQEYTLADTLWNVGLSSVLGAGISGAPAFIRDKVRRNKFNAADIVAEEIDVAMAQLAEGQRVDVSIVEQVRGGTGRIADASEVLSVIESISAQPLPKSFDIAPLVEDAVNIKEMAIDLPDLISGAPIQKTTDHAISKSFAEAARERGASQKRIEYSENPSSWIVVRNSDNAPVLETFNKTVIDKINIENYTPIPIVDYLESLNTNDLPEVVKSAQQSIESSKGARVLEKIEAAQKPEASTAIDVDGAKAMQRRVDELPEIINYEQQFNNDMDKIRSMVDQGIIPESVFDEYMAAIDSMNEADITESLKTLENCLLRG